MYCDSHDAWLSDVMLFRPQYVSPFSVWQCHAYGGMFCDMFTILTAQYIHSFVRFMHGGVPDLVFSRHLRGYPGKLGHMLDEYIIIFKVYKALPHHIHVLHVSGYYYSL